MEHNRKVRRALKKYARQYRNRRRDTLKMKYITKPKPMAVTHPTTGREVGEPLTMDNFLLESVLSDQKFGANIKLLAMVIEIRAQIKKYKDKPYLGLENAEYAEVLESAKAPSTGYNPLLAEPVLAMTEALTNATDKIPKEFLEKKNGAGKTDEKEEEAEASDTESEAQATE